MSALKIATLIIAFTLPSVCHAETFEDSRTGITIVVDDSFYVVSEPVIGQPGASMIAISSRGPHPFVPDSVTPTCVLTQWPDVEFAGMTQSDINADAPNWPADIIADMAGAAELASATPFEHQGLAGMEVVVRLTRSVTNEAYLVFFATATPRGRASIACAAAIDTLDAALPVYRRIRDGVTLPQ